MYALLGAMLVSRVMTRQWVEHLEGERRCNRDACNVGESVAVIVSIKNEGKLPVAWRSATCTITERTRMIWRPSPQNGGSVVWRIALRDVDFA